MKKDEVLDILTEYATNERLDKIILQDAGYIKIKEKADSLLNELEKINSSEEAQKLLSSYDSTTHEAAAFYACFAYKQGAKDIFNLFMSLQNIKEETDTTV